MRRGMCLMALLPYILNLAICNGMRLSYPAICWVYFYKFYIIIIIIMNRSYNIMNWNIRGLNDSNKWLAINEKITESGSDFICIHETKREHFDSRYMHNFCPKHFNKFD